MAFGPNTVRITSPEWRTWLRMRDRKRAGGDHPRQAEGSGHRGAQARGGGVRSSATLRITDSSSTKDYRFILYENDQSPTEPSGSRKWEGRSVVELIRMTAHGLYEPRRRPFLESSSTGRHRPGAASREPLWWHRDRCLQADKGLHGRENPDAQQHETTGHNPENPTYLFQRTPALQRHRFATRAHGHGACSTMLSATVETGDHGMDGGTAKRLPGERQRVGEGSHRCSSADQRLWADNAGRLNKMPVCPQVRHHMKVGSRASVRLAFPQLGEERLEPLCHELERCAFDGLVPRRDRDRRQGACSSAKSSTHLHDVDARVLFHVGIDGLRDREGEVSGGRAFVIHGDAYSRPSRSSRALRQPSSA